MKKFNKSVMRQHWESEASDYTKARILGAVDERLIELLAPSEGDRLLEIGFGSFVTGEKITRSFPGIAYYGLDFSQKFLQIARQKGGADLPLVKASASRLPFSFECFDLILEMDAIHHYPKDLIPAVIQEVTGILKKGGRFILIEDWAATPECEKERLIYSIQSRRHLTNVGLEYHPTEKEWKEMLEDANLTVQKMERIDRPLNFGKFEELKDSQTRADLSRLRELWGDEPPTTLMTIFICKKD